ncbi:hypothetical protein [Streptosporangium minutum]|uniref:Uncharacterized protein n=1 Tax=Streptosporangium minutum TaxID=569862 RepID=A0A243RLH3_9ACTN|nr:hypothetical protein [Streptosporangium minutum]OUC95730.1 hypothetical protein CA984_17705 [Streptosporangium minutum]
MSPEPRIGTLGSLREHLRWAIELEHVRGALAHHVVLVRPRRPRPDIPAEALRFMAERAGSRGTREVAGASQPDAVTATILDATDH